MTPARTRERELIEWIASIGASTDDACAAHLGCTLATSRGRLRACVRAGTLRRTRPLTDVPALYAVTAAGRRLIGAAAPPPARITSANAAHSAWSARAAAVLAARHPDMIVIGERELRSREAAAGRPIASAALSPDGRLHRPDLVLWPRNGSSPIAIEVELTLKSSRRLRAITRAWARCDLVAATVYYAPPAVARAVARTVEAVRGEDRIVVLALDALAIARC